MYSDYEDENRDVEQVAQNIKAIDSFIDTLKSTGEGAQKDAITYLKNSSNLDADIRRALATGYLDPDKKIKVEGAEITIFGTTQGDWADIVGKLFSLQK